VKNLASHLLGHMARVLPREWQRVYGHEVCYLETFVDSGRFAGTCYKAANWISLGKTTGRGNNAPTYEQTRSIKEVLGYPLTKDSARCSGGYREGHWQGNLRPAQARALAREHGRFRRHPRARPVCWTPRSRLHEARGPDRHGGVAQSGAGQERADARPAAQPVRFPPEDCGGIPGYENCVAVVLDKATGEIDDPEYLRGWLGDWRPDQFDLAAAKKQFDC